MTLGEKANMTTKLTPLTLMVFTLFTFSTSTYANDTQSLLKQFHSLGITHCDEFINNNVTVKGNWKFFLTKHADGLDGPATEVNMVQIHGSKINSLKSNYTFVQTLKKCFLHKTGIIKTNKSCTDSINKDIWKLQYNLPDFDYKRFKNAKGMVLFTKELSEKSCLLEYEFRTKGEHSIYRPIK